MNRYEIRALMLFIFFHVLWIKARFDIGYRYYIYYGRPPTMVSTNLCAHIYIYNRIAMERSLSSRTYMGRMTYFGITVRYTLLSAVAWYISPKPSFYLHFHYIYTTIYIDVFPFCGIWRNSFEYFLDSSNWWSPYWPAMVSTEQLKNAGNISRNWTLNFVEL